MASVSICSALILTYYICNSISKNFMNMQRENTSSSRFHYQYLGSSNPPLKKSRDLYYNWMSSAL